MSGEPDRARPDDGDGASGLEPIGPPGWSEFVAAQARFRAALVLQGLEWSLAAADRAAEPGEGGRRPY